MASQLLLASLAAAPDPAGEDPPVTLPPVRVVATVPDERLPLSGQQLDLAPGDAATVRDPADLVAGFPGAAVVRNGPLTGIVQLHGMQNERVKVLVDGMILSPACPNHMDPPLHYVAASGTKRLTVMAGITPVSLGGDSLAGTVAVESLEPLFATERSGLVYGETGLRLETGNRGFGWDGRLGAASPDASVVYEGSWSEAEDYRFPGGTVRATEYQSQKHGLKLGTKISPGLLTVDLGVGLTRDAGTPALPMDMIEDDARRVRTTYQAEREWGNVEARIYHHAIDHRMDNYSLRPAGAMRMFSPAESRDTGGGIDTTIPLAAGRLGGGLEFHGLRFDAYQENAANHLRQDSLNEASRDRLGGYVEWHHEWHPRWLTQVGVRTDAVVSDTADVEKSFPPSAPDRAAFNTHDHRREDVSMDATALVRFRAAAHFTLEAGFARKNRAPSLLERYLWTPLSASAGQADSRLYLGNQDLTPETSHQVGLTLMAHRTNGWIRVTPFWQRVEDYIQGTPLTRLDPNGLPVLQFQNQDRVELYGLDLEARYELAPSVGVRGTLSHVRGRNLSTDDNLYRVAPLRGSVALEHRWGLYEGMVEVVLVDSQHEVSQYNREPESSGYTLLNLSTRFELHRHLELSFALENVFDESYADHLGGINRVGQSDVPVGQRIPGMGRSFITQLRASF